MYMTDGRLSTHQTRKPPCYKKKDNVCLFAVLRKLTLRKIHWHRRTTVQPRSCMSPSVWQTTPTTKKTKKNYTCPRKNIEKPGGGIQNNPNKDTRGKKKKQNCEEEGARKVVRLFGRGEAVFFWRNFERRFQFLRFASCGTSMLSADAPAARPIRLHPKTGFN